MNKNVLFQQLALHILEFILFRFCPLPWYIFLQPWQEIAGGLLQISHAGCTSQTWKLFCLALGSAIPSLDFFPLSTLTASHISFYKPHTYVPLHGLSLHLCRVDGRPTFCIWAGYSKLCFWCLHWLCFRGKFPCNWFTRSCLKVSKSHFLYPLWVWSMLKPSRM